MSINDRLNKLEQLAGPANDDGLEFIAEMHQRMLDQCINLQEALSAKFRGNERELARDPELYEFYDSVLDESGEVNWDDPPRLLERWRQAKMDKSAGRFPTAEQAANIEKHREKVDALRRSMEPQFKFWDENPEARDAEITRDL